jgi:hypothetical protein
VRWLVVMVVCVSVVAAIPAEASRSFAPLGNFGCYTAAFTEFATTRIIVKDKFGTRIASVGRPTELCAPASVNNGLVADSAARLACQPIKLALKSSIRISAISQNFGVFRATITRAIALCAPSSTATGGALRPTPKTLDSFVCYSAVPPPGRFAVRTVTISDEFAKTRDVVLGPVRFCLPATVGTSKQIQSQSLACYEVKSVAKGSAPVVVRSKFGLFQASLGPRRRLCVPSTNLSIVTAPAP